MYHSDFNYAAAASAAAHLAGVHLWLSAIYRPRWVKVLALTTGLIAAVGICPIIANVQ